MGARPAAAVLLLLSACTAPVAVSTGARLELRPDGPKVLCVTAHPDDEIAFAGTVFKTATRLGGACDLLVITNGEGGYKYSTLAELAYGARLTDPSVGRARLPAIRRRELLEAARILHFRRIWFLDQQDHRNTKDPNEVLAADADVWNLELVRRSLLQVLTEGDYDFVLTHLPVPDTHGHHKAATILALRAVDELPPPDRPAVLGAFPGGRDQEAPELPDALDGFPITRIRRDVGPFVFDRAQKFGTGQRLDYQVVVNRAIASHWSQGTYQKLMNRWTLETFYLYAAAGQRRDDEVAAWFARLAEPQFDEPRYDENGDLLEFRPPGAGSDENR